MLFDQRGTGTDPLRCPALQRSVGSSDITPPAPDTVEACAKTLGDQRRFYTTADTVADLELLRDALVADKLTIDGVSYGTYVAERYALAHPERVQRLVLDSVLPHDDIDPLSLVPIRATARVLRDACEPLHCPSDPADDLSAVVAQRHDGVELLDTLTALSIVAPSSGGSSEALREARAGHPATLDAIVAGVRRGQRTPAGFLSQGLHASTLCGDLEGRGAARPRRWPGATRRSRGPSASPSPPTSTRMTARRRRTMGSRRRACAGRPRRCRRCRRSVARSCRRVPVLLLAGHPRPLDADGVGAGRGEARPEGRGSSTVPGAGHGTQSRGGPVARRAVLRFLHPVTPRPRVGRFRAESS